MSTQLRAHLFSASLALVCALGPLHAQENPALIALQETTVTRLEWGLEKFNRALVSNFAQDPLTLEPSMPPFFINVSFNGENQTILIEIGRTFSSVPETRAKELCRDYLSRIRAFLNVDPSGNPVAKGASSLAQDYFLPINGPTEALPEFAEALDNSVSLRGLVASPINGVYSICGANLTHGPIKFVE